jgi:predicted RND superfamily exporter protein
VDPLLQKLLGFACRRPAVVFVLTGLLTLFFGYHAIHLKVDPNVESLIPENSEMRRLMDRNKKLGISGEYLVLAVSSENPLTLGKLAVLDRVLRRLEELPELKPGITPFNLLTFEKKGTRLAVVPLAPGQRAPRSEEELAVFRKRLTSAPHARNLVVSSDTTVLNAVFPTTPIADFASLMDRVRGIVAQLDGYYKYYLSGSVPFVERTGVFLSRDFARLSLVAALAILLFYFLGFRTLRGVILPFLVVALGTLWSMGFMAALGFSLSVVNIVTPPLVLTLGSSYAIHILNQYYRTGRGGQKDAAWIPTAVAKVTRTVLLAALTTVAGFLSLLTTSIRQTREFALASGFGIVACALLALFFLPALLALLKAPRAQQIERVHAGFVARAMGRLGPAVLRRRVLIAAALGVVTAAFLFALTRIDTNTDTISYFPQKDRVVQDMYFLTSKLGGFDEISVTVRAPDREPGYFLQPEPLQMVSALESRLKAIPDICYAVSFPAYLRYMNLVMNGEEGIPKTRGLILLLSRFMRVLAAEQGAGSPAANLFNEDFSELTLSFRIYNSRTGKFIDEQGLRDLLGKMKAVIAPSLPPGAGYDIRGMGLQYLSLSDLLRRNLVTSLLLSILIVFMIDLAAFRSLRFAGLSIVPLVSGVMLNFIFMALVRIPLDMTTIMVSSVAVGVGVDNAIHFILFYRGRRREEPAHRDKALTETLTVTGRPIVLTTVSIVAGLAVLTLASFRPILYFGVLLVFTLSATCASTLVLLPALTSLTPRSRAPHAAAGNKPRGTP